MIYYLHSIWLQNLVLLSLYDYFQTSYATLFIFIIYLSIYSFGEIVIKQQLGYVLKGKTN